MSFRARISKFLVAFILLGFAYPISAQLSQALAAPAPNRAPVITSIDSPNNQTLVITYIPPISADTVTQVFYSTDSGTTYYPPDSDTCSVNPLNGPWVGDVDTCTMKVTLESSSNGNGGIYLLPGVPHSIVLGTFTNSNLPGNWFTSPPGNPPASISNLWMVSGDTSAGIAPFPVISNIFYEENRETIYFDNSLDVNKWWGIAVSYDSGTTWVTPENPGSNNFSCQRAQYAISLNFYSCSISGLSSDVGLQFRYYVDPAGLGPNLQGIFDPTIVDPTQFESGTPSELIYFQYKPIQQLTSVPDGQGDYHSIDNYVFDYTSQVDPYNGSVVVTPGDASLNLSFTAPPITTVGGSGSMRNIYYSYGIAPAPTPVDDQDMSLWNFNMANLKLIDGSSSQSWTISKLPSGQLLTNGQNYNFALAYYIPGLSHFISPAQIDVVGAGAPWNFVGNPVAAPPSITHPTVGATFSGTLGTFFSETMSATGGQAPYTFDVASGMLPPGISVDASTGIFSGTPTAPGTFISTLRATTATGGVDTVTGISIYIADVPATRPDNYYWIEQDVPSPYWSAIASNADGSHLVAANAIGEISTSSDYGATWNQQVTITNNTEISAIASSADGSHLAIVVSENGVWTSVNYGATWTQPDSTLNGIGNGIITALTSSADGSHLAVTVNGSIFLSSDYGASWTASNVASSPWTTIVMNSDGSHISAGTSDGYIWTSTDGGGNWIHQHIDSGPNIHTIASDSSGSILIAGTSGQCYQSIDSGTTWVLGGPSNVTSIVMSSDASRFSVIAGRTLISYTDFHRDGTYLSSTNSDFNSMQDTPTWTLLASNSEGSFLTAAPANGSIWTGLSADFDATLTSGLIKGTSNLDLGTPSRSPSTASAGAVAIPAIASTISILPTIFMPTYDGSSVSRIVKYPAGGDIANFATDAVFTNQNISDGDILVVEVTSAQNSHLYYKFNLSLDPNLSLNFNNSTDLTMYPSFGPTIVGQTDSRTALLSILPCAGQCYLRQAPDLSYANTDDFSLVVVSDCFGEDNHCYIPSTFSPSRIGDHYGVVLVKYISQGVGVARLEKKYELLLLKGSGITDPAPSNPPFAWNPHTVLETQTWRAIASSADGQRLAAVIDGGDIYTSSDAGISWRNSTETGSASGGKRWISIASSSDGMNLSAATYMEGIYLSTDGGLTWNSSPGAPTQSISHIASSADGLSLAVTATDDTDRNYVYTSNDGGNSWTQTSSSSDNWSSISMNSDGHKLVASVGSYYRPYVQNDSYTQGSIWTSIDSGTSWVERTAAGTAEWTSVASNSDGSKLVASAFGGDIWTSSDGGDNWQDHTIDGIFHDWVSVTSSLDGSHLAAVARNDCIYLSEDFGVTWESQTVAGQNNWTSIASSANGSLLAATGTNIDIWTRQGSAPPVAPPAPSYTPSPAQQSKISSITPIEATELTEQSVVLAGSFIESIIGIQVDGNPLPFGSWKQIKNAISFVMPSKSAGTYLIQLYNGAVPLLEVQSFTYTKKSPVVKPAPTPTPISKPAVSPEKSESGSSSDQPRLNPLKSTITTNIYFDMASYVINSKNFIKLAALAKRISGLGSNITIAITGYAQPTPGSEATDGLLSKRRAAAVAKIMRQYGVNTKIIYKGAGRAAVNDATSRYVQIIAANR